MDGWMDGKFWVLLAWMLVCWITARKPKYGWVPIADVDVAIQRIAASRLRDDPAAHKCSYPDPTFMWCRRRTPQAVISRMSARQHDVERRLQRCKSMFDWGSQAGGVCPTALLTSATRISSNTASTCAVHAACYVPHAAAIVTTYLRRN